MEHKAGVRMIELEPSMMEMEVQMHIVRAVHMVLVELLVHNLELIAQSLELLQKLVCLRLMCSSIPNSKENQNKLIYC